MDIHPRLLATFLFLELLAAFWAIQNTSAAVEVLLAAFHASIL